MSGYAYKKNAPSHLLHFVRPILTSARLVRPASRADLQTLLIFSTLSDTKVREKSSTPSVAAVTRTFKKRSLLVINSLPRGFPHFTIVVSPPCRTSKQADDGMLLSCPRRWAGQPKHAEESKSEPFRARNTAAYFCFL